MISTMDTITNAGERFGTEKSQTPGSFAVAAAMIFAVEVFSVRCGCPDIKRTANSKKERAKRVFERLVVVKGKLV